MRDESPIPVGQRTPPSKMRWSRTDTYSQDAQDPRKFMQATSSAMKGKGNGAAAPSIRALSLASEKGPDSPGYLEEDLATPKPHSKKTPPKRDGLWWKNFSSF